jgi:hypothetical protein
MRSREPLSITKLDHKGRAVVEHQEKQHPPAGAPAKKKPVACLTNHRCKRPTILPSGPLWEAILNDQAMSKYTISSYKTALSVMLGIMSNDLKREVDVAWLMLHPDKVLEMLEREYPNEMTRKTMGVSILSLFKHNEHLRSTPRGEEAWKVWDRNHKFLTQIWADRVHNMQPTDREQACMVTWDEVLQAEARLAKNSYGSFDHLCVACYSLISPLRCDLKRMQNCPEGHWHRW